MVTTEQLIIDNIMNNSNLQEVMKLIADVPFETQREEYIKKLASVRNISKQAIARDIRQFRKNRNIVEILNKRTKYIHPACYVDEHIALLGYSIKSGEEEYNVDNVYFLKTQDSSQIKMLSDNSFYYRDLSYTIQKKLCAPMEQYFEKIEFNEFGELIVDNAYSKDNIYQSLKQVVKKYIYLYNEQDYDLVTAYIIMTYFYRCFYSIPFLFVYGPKGSGKSQLLYLLDRLCFNATKCKGITLSSFCNTIDTSRGTMIIDQAEDLSYSGKNLDIISLIADSYTQHGGKRRIMSNGEYKQIEFETFSPKVFASIRDIDEDIRDRCVMINMTRTDVAMPKPSHNDETIKKLRSSLNILFLQHGSQIYNIAKNAVMTNRTEELAFALGCIYQYFNLNANVSESWETIKTNIVNAISINQFELSDNERLLFEIILKSSSSEEIKISDEQIKEKIKRITDNKLLTTHWINSKLKQYGLIESIVKEQGKDGIVVKYYIIKRENLLNKYKKYFIDTEYKAAKEEEEETVGCLLDLKSDEEIEIIEIEEDEKK